MEASQVSQRGRGKNKRNWTKQEEQCLIDGLIELHNDPHWKADGGFKNGFKIKLETMMHEKFPGCELKAVPHIDSKVKWFRDKYNVLSEMFRTSGFSWDEVTHTIKCERQAYVDFCKVRLLFRLLLILYLMSLLYVIRNSLTAVVDSQECARPVGSSIPPL